MLLAAGVAGRHGQLARPHAREELLGRPAYLDARELAGVVEVPVGGQVPAVWSLQEAPAGEDDDARVRARANEAPRALHDACHAGDDVRVLDRKSTRLNSSHLGISYAVF